MKKILGVFVGILILAAVVAPYAIGYRTQQLFRQHVQKVSNYLANRSDGKISIKVTDYDLGYMSSTARTRVRYKGQSFTIDHHLTHGPYMVFGWARIHSHLDASGHAQTRIANIFNGPMLTVNTKFGFFGGYRVHVHSSSLRHPLSGPHARFDWRGMNAVYSRSGNSSHINAKIPALSITQDGHQVAMSDIKLNAAHSGTSRWQHHARVSIRRLGLADGDGRHVSGRVALRVRQIPTHGGKQVSTHTQLTFDNLKLTPSNKPIAKTAHINRFQLKWDLNGLNPDGLDKFADAIREGLRHDQSRTLTPDKLDQQLANLAERYGPDVLTSDTDITLSIPTFQTPSGNANAKLDVALTGNGKPHINILSLLQELSINLHAAANTKLIKHVMAQSLPKRSIQSRLKLLQSRNIIQHQNHRYTLAFHYGNGSYTLNGKPARGLMTMLLHRALNE